jgi:hypothetical protein
MRIRRLSINLFFRRALIYEGGKNKRTLRFPLALYVKAPRGVSNNISKEGKIKNVKCKIEAEAVLIETA